MDRRAFLKSSGMVFCFAFLPRAHAQAAAAKAINAWVRIAPDGTVAIFSAGAEMGQGSMTSLALVVAEEMDADWPKVRIEWAPAEPEVYGYAVRGRREMGITGSRAVMAYYHDLRVAGAQVRKVLLDNAARIWSVDAGSLRTEPGMVVDPSGRRMSYGEIASSATVPSPLPTVDERELKDKAKFRLIGKEVPRRDFPAKVNGTAQYSIDVELPGMVYATARHSPVQGGEPESWNVAKLKSMKGVLATVKLPDGVAIVASDFPTALAARRALQVTWRKGARAEGYDSEPALQEAYANVHADASARRQTLDAKGDAKAAFESAARTYRGEFRSDYGYHAQMEPLNAVARFNARGDAVEVWEGTQAPDASRAAIAGALGFRREQVTLHQCYMGGGFGRRSLGDYAVEAARIARAVKKPVKLIWTREEDLAHGMFRPQSYQCLEAALDAQGKVVGWTHCVVGDGGGLLTTGMRIPYYEVPNQHLEVRGVSHGVRVKHWRAVGHVFNVFAIESFVDQMAAAEGIDPVEFRLQRMAMTPRGRAVFERAVAMSGWSAPRPAGRALGISISERSGSLGAGVAEISLAEGGRIRVHKMWLAVDGGLIVQPDMARANIESGMVYGLSSVLHERATIKGGAVQQSNFHDYHLLRMADMPEVLEVAFVERDAPPSGLGEIGNPWVAAAIANAFYKLTGKRLSHMPFTPARVQEALKT